MLRLSRGCNELSESIRAHLVSSLAGQLHLQWTRRARGPRCYERLSSEAAAPASVPRNARRKCTPRSSAFHQMSIIGEARASVLRGVTPAGGGHQGRQPVIEQRALFVVHPKQQMPQCESVAAPGLRKNHAQGLAGDRRRTKIRNQTRAMHCAIVLKRLFKIRRARSLHRTCHAHRASGNKRIVAVL